MYLKSIEMQGFKSFANKTILQFHDGITGVVGPNGSGKSNVGDAVRWVLGEQSAKQLRGGNMQDVIFSGTETRKPLGYASVAITLDNSDHKLNVDFEEVTVTRRLYRSGESEYLMNGASCRLKDINELFYDTGIGKEGYSIIGQGQIDKILSGKPEERRELFDEAAGIVKFKRRKAVTEKKLAEEQQNHPRDLSSLHGIVTMGSPLERADCIRYQKILTQRIFNGYGTTETFWNTFLRPDDLPEKAGSAGRSCVDDDVRVIRVYDDHPASPDDLAARDGNEVGEVIIRSDAKSAAFYFGNPEETKRRFHDGFFYTNDLGTWDENHFLRIVGRKDDMIISGGENIYPVEVEEVLNLHPGVADCIVTAAPDVKRGEIVTAYIIPSVPSLTAQQLERYCKESPLLANYTRPHYYRFVTELPRNVTGKKMHCVMKQLAELDCREGRLTRV